ncbi:UDP-N-acetylmuramoyl-L-alanine--D-glutamate ligase [Leadbettera azotonutricia]|uniref:UDP-N-acetylmuramoylalanine--D-glutamate ligase n=1 Tax=Leadbettera azotonutricia (strain ATCC BAA-888 / DSM 13862 / ZAS-9) TaxID=545695 RepID=F5YFK6_LEAAZ|nr:UDP-N-acetylmuramoyl-L-alanine--D-glutamate ligase [Leadbettera azotonutricia]AEF82935.1 UDP-N-acetylmuramoyl-L-alanine--D-glutamate ligase [Leadbettera azotonutricia ZAS-9]
MVKNSFAGIKALVMGLGLNGGGIESARYLALRGAEVSVTDLRDEKILAPSIEKLEAGIEGATIRYILGRHDMEDFEKADMVIKNPGVRPDSPYLKKARRIETDISLFLAASPARLSAVTGSKGKSTTASALHWVLKEAREYHGLPGKAFLGGNITVSPLTFLDELEEGDDVVLELSSWQLGDVKGRTKENSKDNGTPAPLLKPRAAVLTAIMPDHLDRYGTMEAYIADKRIIYQGQDSCDATVARDDEWGRSFHRESKGRPLVYSAQPLLEGIAGGWLTPNGGPGIARIANGKLVEVVPEKLLTPGDHQKMNLLAASLALLDLGIDADFIRESIGRFPGIEHRLEFFMESKGVRFYNDSAATIPEAAAAAIAALGSPVLVTGGTDKNLDYAPFIKAAPKAKAILLLAGTGSEKIRKLLDAAGTPYKGPYDSAGAAAKAAMEIAQRGDAIALSPGCTSFGMFLNEFDRGNKWKEAVRKYAEA